MTEFELIAAYFETEQNEQAAQNAHVAVIKSIGDDAAVIDIAQPMQWVTCVDTLVQGRHFIDDWTQVHSLAFVIGYKSVAVNVSDIAAMGAVTHSILLALALPERLAQPAWLQAFSKGLHHACKQYHIKLIGGDTTRSDKLVISITANGLLNSQTKPILRSGAQVGDIVYVSGTVGDAGYALHHPNDDAGQQLMHRLHTPTPRTELANALSQQQAATAMIDVSDGLAQDLGHICQQSEVAMRLHLDNLPTSKALQTVSLTERLPYQLTGGDDYELAFTLPAHIHPPASHTSVTAIGEVIAMTDKAIMDKEVNHNRIELVYAGRTLTLQNPSPFEIFPDLTGFQHFNATGATPDSGKRYD